MFLNPEQTLAQLELSPEMTAVDFGSGSGGWAIPLAKILDKGFVFAVDIQEEPLSALMAKAKTFNLKNIRTVRGDVEAGNVRVDSASCDFALLTNILFQAENKAAVLKEAARALKPGGALLVVDWLPNVNLGPKQGKIAPEQVKEMAAQVGLSFTREIPTEAYHYGLVFTKS